MRGENLPALLRRRRARLFYSVRGRATVVTVVVSAVVLGLCLALGVILAQDAARTSASERAAATVERVVYEITRDQRRIPLAPGEGESHLIQIVGKDGHVLDASPDLVGHPPLSSKDIGKGELLENRTACPAHLDDCVQVVGMRMADSPYGPAAMVYAAESPPTLLSGWVLLFEVLLLLAALLSVIAWWTWRTMGTALAPVEAMRAEMAEITASGLDQRVPVPATGGKIQALGETINHTLERLEESTGRERRFISDASHDLRNPIAGLHTRLEVALAEDDDHDWKTDVRAALADTERLNDIVIDLLELSRLDSRAPAPVERIDLAELVRREVDRRPQQVPISTRLAPGAAVRANTVRLSRVLGNLLSNAERHADSGIEVVVDVDAGEAVLTVTDDGKGIAPDLRERVFERFARLSESRQRDPAGTGLGLPIAREIAQTYGGSLRIADSPRGARFVLRLPLASEGPPAG